MPNASATFIDGNSAARVRRKNVAASRSSTNSQPIGEVASQPASIASRIAAWKRGPRSSGSW